ncbi:MAG: hypothetical protein SF097_18020 [Acidobacteriota bacterium]|nr:hypothetical protein [Acidobacteriota bacterium]
MRHQLFSRLVVALAVLLVESVVSAQQSNTPPKPPPTTQRQQLAQPKVPAKTADGKAEKAPAIPTISREEKEQIFQSTLDGVLSSAFQIEPVEYGIIVQIESAALLWEKDRVRANDILANAWSRLQELMSDKGNSRLPKFGEKLSGADRARLRQSILRRIAKLNPDLIKDWAGANGENAKPVFASGEEGGTAIVAIAVEELQRDPEKAMKLAAQGLSYEALYPASTFLTQLWYKDKQLAEKQALVYLEKLPVGSTVNLFLVTKLHFFLSPPMREKYFEALAVRLRAAFRPDLDRAGYLNLLDAARKGASQAATHPVWRDEYLRLTAEIEAAMASRAVNSATPTSKAISTSGMSPAAPGDTAEIERSSEKLEAIRNQKIKDAEYQRLAIEAAEKADVVLAERLLSKISDETVRRQTSVGVYGPLVGKAMAEKDWPQARSYALKVTDPFGMSLIVDSVAKAMLSAKQDKQMVANFYDDALANLDREKPSAYVAKGIIAIAKSRVSEEQGGFAATNLAVSTLNKLDITESFSSKSGLAPGIGAWINQSNLVLLAEDYFEVTETLGPLFRDLSKRDLQQTQSLASALSHQGLRSLAQLGLAKGLQEDLQKAKSSAGKPKPSANEK